jgi:GT2 family glycosyltransferase
MKNTAVVLLNYNGIALLKKFLPKILRYSGEAQIVLIDNASSDGSVAWVQKIHPTVTCISLSENLGYAGGYNEGLKSVKADYYALVNTDIEPSPNWLAPLITELQTNPSAVAVQPHILSHSNKAYFEYAGAAGGYLDELGIPFCRGRLFHKCEKDVGQYHEKVPIFWASGACFVIRSQTFWKQGGFDARFFAHQEEIDLCWRIFNSGGTIYAISESKVYHIGAATLPPSAQKVFLNHRNSLLMCLKNLPQKKLYPVLFKKLLLDGGIGIYYLLKLNFKYTYAIISAHFAFYKMLNSYAKLRSSESSKAHYFLRKNIVFDYFVLRRLNFKDLNKNYK